MRKIKASPFDDFSNYEEITLFELTERLPSLMHAVIATACFPSLAVLNDLFSKGKQDDGMSGGAFWDKFEISDSERLDLKKKISEKYSIQFKTNETLDNLDKYEKWFSKSLQFCDRKNASSK